MNQLDVAVRAVKGELVPDREVAKAENDELGHRQIAQQLAELAATVPDRSNIALYGPWGSGKSGIGNLLRTDVEGRANLGFARFDAFKYAENPLRRNFISAVAAELEVKDQKFHDDLYSGQTKTTFDVPKSAFFGLAVLYCGLLFAIFFALTLIAALAAQVQQGGFWEDFRPLVKQVVLASFTPAALLSALVVLAGKSLGVERKTEKADSSEQFENLFAQLVAAANKKRIVVFVDELDRCAPGDVVATLDAVRTFLGADKCVFVVAADRQSVEEALNKELKQATPADPVNPYYSSGSAYLDKVFQYQVLVPPLLQASVTRYAVDLVKGRPGVWQELGDRLDLTVSILVPSHVRSPRRVKSLLNAFVLTYRLAEARQKDGRLHGDMILRSDEIARMVCLRVEFPLFARDLVLDARLPDYVLRLRKDESEEQLWKDHPYATPQVKALARGFANRELPVATLLSDPPAPDDDQDDERPNRKGQEETKGERNDRPQDVAEQHGRQLLDYLSRTRSVRGPGRDLLFMQSAGNAVGLDGQLAERLEEDAGNGSVESLCATVDALNDDGRDAAVTLLIGMSLGAIGLEGRNIALSMLGVIALPNVDIPARADEIADALASPVNDAPDLVAEGGLHGAWALGLHSDRPTGVRLRELVLQYALAHEDDGEVAMMVLADSDAAITADQDTAVKILVAQLLAEDGNAAARTTELLLGTPSDQSTRLLTVAGDSIARHLRESLAPPAAPVAAATSAARTSTALPAASSPTLTEEPGLPDSVEDALGLLLDQLDGFAGGPAHALVRSLLTADRRATRQLVQGRLSRLTPTNDPALASLLLTSCSQRSLDEWPAWLSVISPAAAAGTETDDAAQQLVENLWTSATKTGAHPATAQAAASAAVALLDHRTTETRPSIASAVESSFGDPIVDDDRAIERRRLLAAAEPLLLAGALAPGILATKETLDLTATLTAELAANEDDDPIVDYVAATVLDALSGFSRAGVPGEPAQPEARAALVQAIHNNTWIPEPHATRLRLLARMQADERDESLPELPTPDAIRDLRAQHGPRVDDAVSAWLTLARPNAETLLTATDSVLRDGTPSQQLLDAVFARVADYSITDRVAVLHGILDDPDWPAPPEVVLKAVGTAGARLVPDIEVARILATRNIGASNNVRRRHVLQAWVNARIESDNARKVLFETVLIPLFGTEGNTAADAVIKLGLEYLPQLASTQPSKTKAALGEAILRALGEKGAGKVLRPLGYKVSHSGIPLRRRTNVDTSN